jgi:Dolichyl-phosphate-mannose-protein mannosyltransferase
LETAHPEIQQARKNAAKRFHLSLLAARATDVFTWCVDVLALPLSMFSRISADVLRHAAFVFAVLIAFAIGCRGVHFGEHWDEWYHTKTLKNSVDKATLLPGEYTYNGLYFDFGYVYIAARTAVALPKIYTDIAAAPSRPLQLGKYPQIVDIQKRINRNIDRISYTLSMRVVFLAFSLLSIVFAARAVERVVPKAKNASMVVAVVLSSSFELMSHARFIAVDALMAACGAAALYAAAAAVQGETDVRRTRAVVWSGIAAGLAMSCKMTGIFVVGIMGLAALLAPVDADASTLWLKLKRVALGSIASFVAFAVTTPGIVLEPLRFIGAIAFEARNYHDSPVVAHVVSGPFEALQVTFIWLSSYALSPFAVPAIALFACSLLGFSLSIKKHWRFVLICAIFSVVYLAFCATSRQVIVRNTLILVPVLALGLGLCVSALSDLAWVRAERALVAGVLVLGVVSWGWQGLRANRVKNTTAETLLTDVVEWARAQPPLAWSSTLRERVGDRLSCIDEPAVLTADSRVVFVAMVDATKEGWLANRPGLVERTFGSEEVNPIFYPTWHGRHHKTRVVVVDTDSAAQIKLKLEDYQFCTVL